MLLYSKSALLLTLALGLSTVSWADDAADFYLESDVDAAAAAEAYWTPERMRTARPQPLPTEIITEQSLISPQYREPVDLGAPAIMPAWSSESDEPQPTPDDLIILDPESLDPGASVDQEATYGVAPSNPLTGPYGPFQRWTMHGKYQVWPRFIHGKLFFSKGGENYVCSGSVIGPSLVATAGHCVSDGAGNWATNVLFCPGYSQVGAMPGYGCWAGPALVAPTNYRINGERDYDYGFVITNPTGTVRNQEIGNAVGGYAGWAVNWPSTQPVIAFGYPSAAPFQGDTIQQVAAVEWYEDDRSTGSQLSKYIGSDMTGGSSGGGWFVSWRHPSTAAEIVDTDGREVTDPLDAKNGPYLIGINSHKRCRVSCSTPPTATSGTFWQEMGSPQFLDGSDAKDWKSMYDLAWSLQP